MSYLRRYLLFLSVLHVLYGCASLHPLPSPAPDTSMLHSVAVVPSPSVPAVTIHRPSRGVVASMGRKGARWMGEMFAGGVSGGGSSGDGLAAMFVVALTTAASVVAGMAGCVVGGFQALPVEKLDAADTCVQRAFVLHNLQNDFATRVTREVEHAALRNAIVVAEMGPAEIGTGPPATDAVVEVSITRFGLEGPWDVNPPLSVMMTGRYRLLLPQGTELNTGEFTYRGPPRLFEEWGTEPPTLLANEVETALEHLAASVVDEALLVERQSQRTQFSPWDWLIRHPKEE